MNQKQTDPWQLVAIFGSAVCEVIVLTIGGAWIGRRLDALWNMKPAGLLLGVFGGLLIGFLTAAFTFKAFTKDDRP